MLELSNAETRRIALAAQGFTDSRPAGRIDVRHLRRVVGRIGLIQIDAVNVAVRTHYMPLFSRLGPYPHALIDDVAYRQHELFEYWGHMASFVPVRHYPLMRHRMAAMRPGRRVRDVEAEHPGYVEGVLDEVRRRGPLTVSELEDGGRRTGPWWGHGKGKTALEWLFATGRLTVRGRRNFSRVYDLPERFFPPEILAASAPDVADARRELLRLSARAHGIGTASDLADYYRIRTKDAVPYLDELVAAGQLEAVRVAGWRQPAYLDPAAKRPRRVDARALVSPFDSLVWFRERTERLFGFHYRIEIYVPRPKRKYGYYVLPFLLGDALVARVDLKADRPASTLRVQGAFVEDGQDPGRVAGALAEELGVMAGWLGLERVRVGRRGNLTRSLRAALGG